ncbi:MAG: hypothetical protein ABIW76_22280 [Fibrobacteria bacterium]
MPRAKASRASALGRLRLLGSRMVANTVCRRGDEGSGDEGTEAGGGAGDEDFLGC